MEWARGPWKFQAITHLTANHRIDFIDGSNATGIGHGLGLFKLEDGTTVLATARLKDRYECRDGAWKIASRKVAIVSSFALKDATALILNGNIIGGDATA